MLCVVSHLHKGNEADETRHFCGGGGHETTRDCFSGSINLSISIFKMCCLVGGFPLLFIFSRQTTH